jgi:hypothetical protein
MSKKCETMPKKNKEHGGTWKPHLTTLRNCWNKEWKCMFEPKKWALVKML